jgi:hypothetical protein
MARNFDPFSSNVPDLRPKARNTYRIIAFDDATPTVYAVQAWHDGRLMGLLCLGGPPLQSTSRDLLIEFLTAQGFEERPLDDDEG